MVEDLITVEDIVAAQEVSKATTKHLGVSVTLVQSARESYYLLQFCTKSVQGAPAAVACHLILTAKFSSKTYDIILLMWSYLFSNSTKEVC